MNVADEIFAIFERHGSNAYFGERVSMTEHALQAAYFAHQDSAPARLVIAALLHDIGHLLEDIPTDITDWTTDARHEEVGSRWLAMRFGAEISNPVRLHVPAKRYLCAVDPGYVASLSPASVVTLKLQGGPMMPKEIAGFETQDYFNDAVRIRRWDDRGKISGLPTPSLTEYRQLIDALRRQPATD